MANVSTAESPCALLQMKDPTEPATAATNDTNKNQSALFRFRKSNGMRTLRYASAYTAKAKGSTRANSSATSTVIPEYRANENVARYAERNAHSNPSQNTIQTHMTRGGYTVTENRMG